MNDKFDSLLIDKKTINHELIIVYAKLAIYSITIIAPIYAIISYYSDGVDAFALLIFAFILSICASIFWIFSIPTLLIYLFRKSFKKYHAGIVRLLAIHISAILLTLLFLFVADKTQIKKHYSSKYYTNEFGSSINKNILNFKSQRIQSPDGKYFLLVYFKDSAMSFGSGNKVCALYKNSNKLVDDILLGEFSFELINWDEKSGITFSVYCENKEHFDYIKNWTKSISGIGPFKISFEFKTNENNNNN